MAKKRVEHPAFSADVNSGSLTKLGSGPPTQTLAACENAAPNQGRFQPGQSGNPAGRPKGSKNEFVEDFWRDLRDAWAKGGQDCLTRMMRDMPDKFVIAAAGKIPAEVEHTSTTYVIVAPEASTSTQEWLDSLSVRRPGETIQ